MEALQNLLYGFTVALQPQNLSYCFLGVLIGTLIGVLPGIGPTATMSLLLPLTYHIHPISSIIMLSGIFMGANYGCSTSSILVNIPGEASSVVTCFDGYMMAKKGRAGAALGISAFGSFIAATLSIFGLVFFAPVLARAGLSFGPAEYVSLVILSMSLMVYLAKGSVFKSFMMAALGFLLGSVGMDFTTGKMRFTYDLPQLMEGIDIVPLIMGLFGIAEILTNVENILKTEIYDKKIKGFLPSKEDWKRAIRPILRGTGIGFFLGIIPGIGAIIPTFVDYAIEKRLSKTPEAFGTGMIEGVAGPESTNNAACQATFIPLFSLGIPPSAVMAVLMGALMIHGLQPSPMMIKESPDLFWGVVSSMYIANAFLLVLNLPLIPLWVRFLRIPYYIFFPLISLFCVIGAYSIRNTAADVYIMIFFGFVGFLMRKFKYEMGPLIMAFVLGPVFELSFRQSLKLSHGSLAIFVQSPISLFFLALTVFVLLSPLLFKRRIQG
jgi:putative tricarboxylic transport membrane protein